MARVILEMDVHCTDCARKIHRAIQYDHGVEKVSASPQTGLVVVSGTADAERLRRTIQNKLGTPVKIVSHGRWAPQPPYAYQYGGAGNRWARYDGEEAPRTCCSIQ